MFYSVTFLKEGDVLDRFAFRAGTAAAVKTELLRVLAEFRRRRPGAKDIMSVSADAEPAGQAELPIA